MNRKIIAVTGCANSGKDTFADYILQKNPTFKKLKFASPIKDVLKQLCGFTEEQLNEQIPKKTVDEFWEITPRQAMLLVGTDMFRNVWRKDFWLKILQKTLIDNPNQNYIISDLRFDNEAVMIRKYNGANILVERTNNKLKIDHESEKGIALDLIDIKIKNQNTLEGFYEQIASVNNMLKGLNLL